MTLDHRMATAFNIEHCCITKFGLPVIKAHGGGGKSDEAIEFCNGTGYALQERDMYC